MNRFAPLTLILLWVSVAVGQPQPLAKVVAPTQIAEHTAARIVCDTTADDVRFEIFELLQLRDSTGRTVEVPGPPVKYLDFSAEGKRQYAFTARPGRYLLRFDCVDYDDRTRQLFSETIEIIGDGEPDKPDKPDPKPPEPDVPADRFGNVGQFAAGLVAKMPAASKSKAASVAKAYSDTAEDIRKGTKEGLNFNETIGERFDAATGTDSAWTEWWESVLQHLDKPAYFKTRSDVADAYEAIAAGVSDGT